MGNRRLLHDAISAIVIIVFTFPICFVLYGLTMLEGIAYERADPSEINEALWQFGTWTAITGGCILPACAAIWTIVQLARRRHAWWIPIVGIAAGIPTWLAGMFISVAAID